MPVKQKYEIGEVVLFHSTVLGKWLPAKVTNRKTCYSITRAILGYNYIVLTDGGKNGDNAMQDFEIKPYSNINTLNTLNSDEEGKKINPVSKLDPESPDNLKKMILILMKRIDSMSLKTPKKIVLTDLELDNADPIKLEIERNIYLSAFEVSVK